MGYVLNQLNQPAIAETAVTTTKNYMTIIPSGTASRRKNASDQEVTGGSLDPFYDECIIFEDALTENANYYVHVKIKRLTTDQIFYLYLVNYDSESEVDIKTQYLKTITVQAGSVTDWADLELLFSPLYTFDCLLFQLQRTIDDYKYETRYPRIIYEEFSSINNAISSKIQNEVELVKIGVQSHPGLVMCINGEEIHIGRSGSYEMRNGIVTVNFFSVIIAAIEDISGTDPLTAYFKREGLEIVSIISEVTYNTLTPEEKLLYTLENATFTQYMEAIANEANIVDNDDTKKTNSKCIFGKSKLRGMDAFVLDYMYKEEE